MSRIITICLIGLLAGCTTAPIDPDYYATQKPSRYQSLNYNTGELEYWNVRGNRVYNYTTGEFGSIRSR